MTVGHASGKRERQILKRTTSARSASRWNLSAVLHLTAQDCTFFAELPLNTVVHADRYYISNCFHTPWGINPGGFSPFANDTTFKVWNHLEQDSVETGWNARTRSLIYWGVQSFLDGSTFVWSDQSINFLIDAHSVWVHGCRMSSVLPTRRSGLMNWFFRTGWPADSLRLRGWYSKA